MDDPEKETIEIVKERIFQKLHLGSTSYYSILYNDEELDDHLRVAHYNIHQRSHIQLTVRSKPALITRKQHSATLDYKSTFVEVPETGVRLDVPEGAIPKGETQYIRLSVHWGIDEHPSLENNQFVIGPTICCEPDGTTFSKPVTLTLPHSARNITSRNLTVWTKASKSKYSVFLWKDLTRATKP